MLLGVVCNRICITIFLQYELCINFAFKCIKPSLRKNEMSRIMIYAYLLNLEMHARPSQHFYFFWKIMNHWHWTGTLVRRYHIVIASRCLATILFFPFGTGMDETELQLIYINCTNYQWACIEVTGVRKLNCIEALALQYVYPNILGTSTCKHYWIPKWTKHLVK